MQGDIVQFENNRGISGYGTALLVKETGEELYSLYLPLEEVPSVYGSTESFDYNILISMVKGKVMGKQELDDVDIEVMLHRDNILRIQSLTGKVLDFLVLYQDGTGYTFSAETKFRPNNAADDILRGNLTFTPSSADPLSLDVRDLIKQTVKFAQTIPNMIAFNSENKEQKVVVKIEQPNATYEVKSNNSKFTVTQPDDKGIVTITATEGIDTDQYGIIYITAGSSDKIGSSDTLKYAPWTTTIGVSYTV